jgi:trk system potassium uptake protein TrkA
VYIIIVGAGAAGSHIASLLSKEGQEITVVEQSGEVAENVRRQLDVGVIAGDAATPRVLREAGVERADLMVAVTDSDETNMIACFMAKELGADKTVARVRNPEYSGYLVVGAKSPYTLRRVVRPRSLGIDLFVNPEIEAANGIVGILSSLYVTPVEEFADGRVQVREFKVEKAVPVVDKRLGDITFPRPCVVVLVAHPEEIKVPGDDEIIREGDHVYLLAARRDMDELGANFGQPKLATKNVMVFGGGNVGLHVAQELEKRGVQVKLIEKSASRCQELSTKLKRTVVVQGGGPDRDLLTDEGVASSDAFVAATGDEALNILAGLVAKSLGAARSIVLVDKPEYIPLAEAVGVDVAVSPLLLCGSKVARFVLHGGAIAVALLGNEQAQAMEFIASPAAAITGRKGKDIKLPEEAIMGAIARSDAVIIPPGDNAVEPWDHVVVVSLLSSIPSVEKLFK